MKSKIACFSVGDSVPFYYGSVKIGAEIPTSLVGHTFVFTIADYETGAPVTTITEASMTVDDNGGSPYVSFLIPTASGFSPETLYDYDFRCVSPTYGPQTIERGFLWLQPAVAEVP